MLDQEQTQGNLKFQPGAGGGTQNPIEEDQGEDEDEQQDFYPQKKKEPTFMKKVYSQQFSGEINKGKSKKINSFFALALELKYQNDLKKRESENNQLISNNENENQQNPASQGEFDSNNQEQLQQQQREEQSVERQQETNTLNNVQTSQKSPQYKRDKKISHTKTQIMSLKTKNLVNNLEGKSLFVFSKFNKFRMLLNRLLSYKSFDNFILVVILISSIMLILQNPLNDPASTLNQVVTYFDMGITGIFMIECFIKITVYGFIFNGPKSYIRNGWNMLDFFIVTLSLISFFISGDNLNTVKVLRLLRILRPLRMISRNEGLKLCVKSLILAIPGIINVIILSLIFLLIFGIFFTNLFKGKLFQCYVDGSVLVSVDPINTKWDCLNVGAEWIDQPNNFNNVLNSMYTLFAVSTTDNWAITLYASIDATEINYQPIRDNNFYIALIFCAFTTFGFLFILNLFMEVVVNTFHREKEKLEKVHLITESQKEWVQTQILSLNCKPLKKRINTDNKLRNWCLALVEAKYFEKFILSIIFCNTIALTLFWVNIDQRITNTLEKINYFFVCVFTFEAILKLIAYGKLYFYSGWNCFDFIIVVLAWVGIVIKLMSSVQVVAETTLIRTFRICRIFRLIKKAKALNAIFNSVVISLPAIGNLGALLLLIMYLYAILGMNIFATIQLQNNINPNVNFQSFGFSLLALFRVATGDNWQLLMQDCMLSDTIISPCNSNPLYSDYVANNYNTVGCGTQFARLYFISFTLIVTYIFLNLFLAIIIDGFSDSNQQINYKITENEMEVFQEVWSEFDPNGTGFIKIKDMSSLLIRLVQVNCTLVQVKELIDRSKEEMGTFIEYLELHSCNKFTSYHFSDVLNSLATISLKFTFTKKEEFEKVNKEIENKFGLSITDINDMIDILDQKGEEEKIKVCVNLTQKRIAISNKILKFVDQFEGNFYDSRHIENMAKIQIRLRELIDRMRETKIKKAISSSIRVQMHHHPQIDDEQERLIQSSPRNRESIIEQNDLSQKIQQEQQMVDLMTFNQFKNETQEYLVRQNKNSISSPDMLENTMPNQLFFEPKQYNDANDILDENENTNYNYKNLNNQEDGEDRLQDQDFLLNVSPKINSALDFYKTQDLIRIGGLKNNGTALGTINNNEVIDFYSNDNSNSNNVLNIKSSKIFNKQDEEGVQQEAEVYEQINEEEEQESQSLIINSKLDISRKRKHSEQDKSNQSLNKKSDFNSKMIIDEERGGCIDDNLEEEKLEKVRINMIKGKSKGQFDISNSSNEEQKSRQKAVSKNDLFFSQKDVSFNQNNDQLEEVKEELNANSGDLSPFATNQKRLDSNTGNTLNTPGRTRKKNSQPQQKDRGKGKNATLNNQYPQNTGSNTVQNFQTIGSDTSSQGRRIFFNYQPQAQANQSNSRIRDQQQNQTESGDIEQNQQEHSSSQNSKKKLPTGVITFYNIGQEQIENFQELIAEKQNSENMVSNLLDSAAVENKQSLLHKSSENSIQLLSSFRQEQPLSLNSSQDERTQKRQKRSFNQMNLGSFQDL